MVSSFIREKKFSLPIFTLILFHPAFHRIFFAPINCTLQWLSEDEREIVKIFDLIIKCTKRNILKFIPLSEIVNCFHVYLCKENNEIMEKVNTTNKLLLKLNRGRIRKREIMMTTRIRITSFKNVMVMDIAICSLKLYIYTNI